MTVPARSGVNTATGPATEDELIARWIEPDPIYPAPMRAWITDHAVAVTSVVSRWQLAHGDVEDVMRAYEVPAEAVTAALAYYERHKAVR